MAACIIWHPLSRSGYLTRDVITRALCAAAVMDLGGCVTPEVISSYTYLDYLRDTPRLARQHAASLANNLLFPDVYIEANCTALTPSSFYK